MRFRLSTFAIHLAASVAVLLALFGVFYFAWYAWPAWYLLGAASVVGLMVLVDVVLGPLMTLLVASPHKPRAELRRDIALIVLVQVAALLWGALTLWQGRPLYYALTLDRIELITAAEFDAQGLAQAKDKGATIMPTWSTLPQWIWAPLPENADERERIIAGAVMEGKDIVSMPEYFRPWADGLPTLQAMLHPLNALEAKDGLSLEAYQNLLKQLAHPAENYGWLLMQGPRASGRMVFERQSGKPVLFVQAEPRVAK